MHHKDPTKKVSHRIWSWSKQRRELELKKCVVLCGECHKEATRLQRLSPHGTDTRYRSETAPCRCVRCTEAHRLEVARYRMQKCVLAHNSVEEY